MNLKHIVTITLVLSASVTTHAAVSVTAQFKPHTIPLGDEAQYVISITQTESGGRPKTEAITSLPIPQTGGLTLQNGRVSSSQQTTIVNLEAQYSITQNVIIEAIAPRIGSYTVPSFTFTYMGEQFTAPSATLKVVERPDDAPPPINDLIFLRFEAPETLYTGQSSRMELKLYIHEQVRYRGYDDFNRNANGFTVSELPTPTETVERVGNYRYKVATWPLTITPIQSGKQELSFEFSVIADVPRQRNRNDAFGSSPFRGFEEFFSTRSERFNLFSEPETIKVLPLPEAGKPASFSGAIGDFTIKVTNDAKESRVGEPIMLSLSVSGSGNLERFNPPELVEDKAWRSYKPEAMTVLSESNPLKGSKRFDYVFVPQQAGKQKLPEVEFSFFDPNDKAYVTLNTPPMMVDVGPSLQAQINVPQTKTIDSDQAANQQLNLSLSPEAVLLTLDYQPVPSSPTGFALLQQPLFYLANSAALLGLLGIGALLHRRKRIASDTAYAALVAARSELREAMQSTSSAELKQDAEAFFKSAQNTVRLAATVCFKTNLRTAEIDEIVEHMLKNDIASDSIDAAKQLFKQADALRFSGRANTTTQLKQARQQLDTVIKSL